MRFVSLFLLAASLLGLTLGCERRQTPAAATAPPVVPVSAPVQREVTEFVEYTGRTDAVQSVSVRARVTGYLTKMPFEEGSEVAEGDLLFEIDPRPYKSLVDQAQSQVGFNRAQLKLAQANYDRDKTLLSSNTISQQQLDQDRAAVEEGEARIKVTQATLETANLNLSFTEVRSPLAGRVSRYYYTVGNLVTQDQTLLTTIVSMDPMYAYFDVDARTYGKINKATAPGPAAASTGPKAKAEPPAKSGPTAPVLMGLEGEAGFPRKGRLNFVNNQVNPSTGTVAARAVFDNTQTEAGAWALIPGMFARIRLPIGEPHQAMLVIDRAIGSDQGLKFVYVLDGENKVQYRRVVTGSLEPDGLRVIEDGLKADDKVVVGGLQQLRPRAVVRPEPTAMPTLAVGAEIPTPARRKPQPPPPGGGGKGKK